jgi:hypothetical protein
MPSTFVARYLLDQFQAHAASPPFKVDPGSRKTDRIGGDRLRHFGSKFNTCCVVFWASQAFRASLGDNTSVWLDYSPSATVDCRTLQQQGQLLLQFQVRQSLLLSKQ